MFSNIEQVNVCVIRVPEVRENGAEYIFEEIIAKKFSIITERAKLQL